MFQFTPVTVGRFVTEVTELREFMMKPNMLQHHAAAAANTRRHGPWRSNNAGLRIHGLQKISRTLLFCAIISCANVPRRTHAVLRAPYRGSNVKHVSSLRTNYLRQLIVPISLLERSIGQNCNVYRIVRNLSQSQI